VHEPSRRQAPRDRHKKPRRSGVTAAAPAGARRRTAEGQLGLVCADSCAVTVSAARRPSQTVCS
jgi:hypothetical protein